MDLRSRSPLLKALHALKPNAIYAMAPSRVIASAAAMLPEDPVRQIRWGTSGKVLEVCFNGREAATVRLTLAGGQLQWFCVGDHEPQLAQRFQVAALMMIARLLHGSRFHVHDLPAARLEELKAALLPEKEEEEPRVPDHTPRLLFKQAGPGQPFTLDYQTGRRSGSWISQGAPEGMEFLNWQWKERERVAEGFGTWLQQKPPELEIQVQAGGSQWAMKEASWHELELACALRPEAGEILSRTLLLGEGGRPRFEGVETIPCGYGLLFAPEEKAFIRVRGPVGQAPLPSQRVTPEHFCRLAPEWPQPGLRLYDHSGRLAKPTALPCRGRLEVQMEGDRPRLCLGAADDLGRALVFPEWMEAEWNQWAGHADWALLTKSPTRRQRVYEWFNRMDEGDAGAILEEVGNDPAFTSYTMYGEEAVKCLRALRQLLRRWNQPRLTLDWSDLEQPWRTVSGWGTIFTGLLQAATGWIDLFRLRAFCAPLEGQLERLPLLASASAANDTELRLDGVRVATTGLELSVGLERSASRGEEAEGMDWFELHPEARAGEWVIPPDQWKNVLEQGHLRQGDLLLMIEPQSLENFRAMQRLLEEGRQVSRLQLFDWLALRERGVACELPPEESEVLHSLLQLESLPAHPLPERLYAQLRDYQRRGYEWLAFLYQHRFGACLADDMGLGKTLQLLALLAARKEGVVTRAGGGEPLPHLLVLPPTLLFNWQNEMARFTPDLRFYEYTGQQRSTEVFREVDVILTTYGLVRRDIEALSALRFDIVVMDEAQAIKNATAAQSQALTKINARFRVCLTGTPLENRIAEFHSIMDAAVPGALGTRRSFVARYEAGEPVLQRAKPFLLRRTREKILSELPPKVENDIYFPLSAAQKECYTRAVGEVRRDVLAAYSDRPAQQAGMIALAALTRLRQVCIAPAMLSEELEANSPKLEYLVDQLAALQEEGHAALVFSQFTKALDLVSRALEEAALPFLRLDGSTPTPRRKELVESFASGESPGIFLISLKAGGAGLNLPRANYVYHLDPWWNPAVEAQATARAHRLGQEKGVFVQRLLMSHTVEEKMMSLKERKQALFEEVIEHGNAASADGGAMLTADDFRFLLGEAGG